MAFATIPELKPLGTKAIEYMTSLGCKIRALNIVYFEGIDTDLKTLNNDRLNEWNDVRAIISNKGDVLMCCQATMEPGGYYTYNRMNPLGVARIAFGQYLDAWQIGLHHSQPALVQCGTIKVYRDNNEDGFRTGDTVDVGDDFSINQHTTGNEGTNNAPDVIGRWSAGCAVGRYSATHYDTFMPIVRSMGLETFDSTFLSGEEFVKFCKQA